MRAAGLVVLTSRCVQFSVVVTVGNTDESPDRDGKGEARIEAAQERWGCVG